MGLRACWTLATVLMWVSGCAQEDADSWLSIVPAANSRHLATETADTGDLYTSNTLVVTSPEVADQFEFVINYQGRDTLERVVVVASVSDDSDIWLLDLERWVVANTQFVDGPARLDDDDLLHEIDALPGGVTYRPFGTLPAESLTPFRVTAIGSPTKIHLDVVGWTGDGTPVVTERLDSVTLVLSGH